LEEEQEMTEGTTRAGGVDRPEKVEYRVMRFSEKHGIWFSHTGGSVTDNPDIAEAWLGQAKHHGAARLETRRVTVWAEVTDD
jgi:hypothetical protein